MRLPCSVRGELVSKNRFNSKNSGEATSMIQKHLRNLATVLTSAYLLLSPLSDAWAGDRSFNPADSFPTATPIKHLVVIFQENISFDHYFATYPHAVNPPNEPAFHHVDDTPRVNNLLSGGLLTENPNSAQPFRLDRAQALTCDQDHNYADEQKAFHMGLMDKFPESVGQSSSVAFPCPDYGHINGDIVMGYFDGNTVTAIWNYAQHFAMSDNHFGTMFGPSTVGALNLISGYTVGATVNSGNPAGNTANGATSDATIIGDPRPFLDDCHPADKTYVTITNGNKNVGDLLNDKGLSWGWFAGGFAPTSVTNGIATCGAQSSGIPGVVTDYVSHHEPFLYYPQTANQHHVHPASPSVIGTPADKLTNRQYDLNDFWTAVDNGQLPAVSYLKAKALNDGHPGNSDPLDEQTFIVNTINHLESTPEWKSTAVIILYDDSDGWYDHVMDPVVNQSAAADDNLTGPGSCGVTPPDGVVGRCGYGPRQPLLVISPFAKQNYVDHRITDQSSVLRFIEDNWKLGRLGNGSTDAKAGSLFGMFDFDDHGGRAQKLILDPQTGKVVSHIF
jgi:phospholipase C